jgi:glyoxylase-like metal-dependent hydrolase (beta-lactamase superfamily II)
MTRRNWWRTASIALAALAVIGAGVYYWLFLESPKTGEASFALDMKEVRRLADSLPGEHPTSVRFEHVMDFKAPAAATVTGDGWSQSTLWGVAYQVIYPGHTLIIDTAMSNDQAKAMGTVSAYHPEAYAHLMKAMSSAQMILVTHEHADHIGGLAAHPDIAHLFKTSVKITREQANNPEHSKPAVIPEDALTGYRPLAYDGCLAVAPGVVLIKAPGHALGSQMVFVKEADGMEILFLGDVAWIMRNVELVRGRPRYISNMLGEQRNAVLNQLATVHALAAAEPKLVIVPGHDAATIADLARRGVMQEGFQ